jgi:hypothetical protein
MRLLESGNDRVIFVGDVRQHEAVEAGSFAVAAVVG